jgi:hypothetical protein
MSDLFDTRDVNDDAEHWDALAERVAREAARQSRVGLIAASLLFAASLAFMSLTWNQGSAKPTAELGQALAPTDDVGRAMALTGKPPAVAALLFDQPRAGGGQP